MKKLLITAILIILFAGCGGGQLYIGTNLEPAPPVGVEGGSTITFVLGGAEATGIPLKDLGSTFNFIILIGDRLYTGEMVCNLTVNERALNEGTLECGNGLVSYTLDDISSDFVDEVADDKITIDLNVATEDGNTGDVTFAYRSSAADGCNDNEIVYMNSCTPKSDLGVLSDSCDTAWTPCEGTGMCMPYDVAATYDPDGSYDMASNQNCSKICFDETKLLELMTEIPESSCTLAEMGAQWIDEMSSCLALNVYGCMDEYPPPGTDIDPALEFYSADDLDRDDPGGALAYIFDAGITRPEPGDTLYDTSETCAGSLAQVQVTNARVTRKLDLSSADCVEVASRFVVDPAAEAKDMELRKNFSLQVVKSGGHDYIKIFYDGTQLFWNLLEGIDRNLFGTTDYLTTGQVFATYAAAPPPYDDIQLSNVNKDTWVPASIGLGRITPDNTNVDKGDGLPHHYMLTIGLLNCGEGGETFEMVVEVVGECIDERMYDRWDFYMLTGGDRPPDESGEANLNSIFLTGAEVDALVNPDDVPIDYQSGHKTLRDLSDHCIGMGSFLVGIPYVMHGGKINQNVPVCGEVLKQFVKNPHAINSTGVALIPRPMKVVVNDHSTIPGEDQIYVALVDNLGNEIFPIYSAVDFAPDGTPDPVPKSWFATADQRASAQHDILNGGYMSIYTEGGVMVNGYNRVGSYLDIHRVYINNMMVPGDPFYYVIYTNLTSALNGAGDEEGEHCSWWNLDLPDNTGAYDIESVIDGKCFDDL